MLPTFSVNVNTYNPVIAKRLIDIAESIDVNNQLMMEWTGEAVLKAVEDGAKVFSGNLNLGKYSDVCNRNDKLNKLNRARKETSLLTQDEVEDGFVGTPEKNMSYEDELLNSKLSDLDADSYIEMFLDKREELFLKKGVDIWRLVQLALVEDKQARNKLRVIMEEYNLREMFEYILLHSNAKLKLEGILCSHSQ